MKKLPLLGLALFVATMRGGEDSGYKPESKATSEIFTSKVLKAYSFQEGDHRYVAYVVTWKDHEVVVSPMAFAVGSDEYKVGDTIPCEMRQTYVRPGEGAKGQITFSILSGPGATVPLGPSPLDEARRLEAVAREVARRREQREAAATSRGQPNSSPIAAVVTARGDEDPLVSARLLDADVRTVISAYSIWTGRKVDLPPEVAQQKAWIGLEFEGIKRSEAIRRVERALLDRVGVEIVRREDGSFAARLAATRK